MNSEAAKIAAWTMCWEGSFTLYTSLRYRGGNQDILEYKTVVAITQKNIELLKIFQALVGYGRIRLANKDKEIYQWHIRGMAEINAFCKDILPYMPAKREQAELMIKFTSRSPALTGNPFRRSAEEDWTDYQLMKRLHGKEI